MEFRKVLALRGPNIWARFPVLEAWVDLQELKDSPSNVLPGFNDRVMADPRTVSVLLPVRDGEQIGAME